MSAPAKLRRWTDARDGSAWEVLFAPGVEEDTPAVRHLREGLVFRGPQGEALHAPAPFGWDLESLSEGDLQGLLDQARQAKRLAHREAGWGEEEAAPPAGEAEEAAD